MSKKKEKKDSSSENPEDENKKQNKSKKSAAEEEKEMDQLEDKTLSEIYTESDGEESDLTKIERAPSVWHVVIVWLLVFVVLAVASWFLWSYVLKESVIDFKQVKLIPDTKVGTDVTIEFEGNEEVASGEETVFTLVYTNNETVLIRDVEIVVRYPEDFIFLESAPTEPVNSYNTLWKIGSLDVGETQRLEITGQILGEVGSAKELQATISYTPLNFHSRFSERTTLSSSIKDSVIGVAIEAPLNIINGQEVEYTVTYTNKSTADINDVVFRITLPEEFELVGFEPEPTREKDWEIETLLAEEEQSITIIGVVSGDREEAHEVVAQAGIVQNNSFKVQTQLSHIATFVTPEVDLFLDQSAAEDELSFGGEIAFTLGVTNKSDVLMKDGVLSVVLTDTEGVIDAETFRFPRAVPRVEEEGDTLTLIWEERDIEALGTFEPEDAIAMSFSVNILDVPLNLDADEFVVNAYAALSIGSPDIEVGLEYETKPVDVHVEATLPDGIHLGDDSAI